MAVNVAAVPTAMHDYTNRLAHYAPPTTQGSYSSGSATPSSASPSSSRDTSTSPIHQQFTQQLRPLRAPTYIPAVLRPTEAPSRHRPSKSSSSNCISRTSTCASPTTPPSSLGSSLDSKDGQRSMQETLQKRILADEGITRIVTDEWNEETLENVTGAPTRDHWKPDTSSPTCDAPICATNFTWRRRRHHCRRCGLVFCSEHSIREVPLDQHARFHPQGFPARACDTCWSDFQAWKRRRGERGSSSSSTIGSGTATPTAKHSRASSTLSAHLKSNGAASSKHGKDAIVGSVPRDWNWSTF